MKQINDTLVVGTIIVPRQECFVLEKDKRKRKIRYVAIALVVGVITLTCIWIATRSENKEMPGKQFVDMGDEDVDMPDQAANGFDFEWKD